VATISFALIRFLPGGPIAFIRAQLIEEGGRSPAEVNALLETYTNVNPEEPLYVAYVKYVSAVLQGDLGTSIAYGDPVIDILAGALPWTVFIMSIALTVTFVLGVTLGAFMAYNEGGRFDLVSTFVSFGASSIPYYIIALFLIVVFGYNFGWFPTGGQVDYNIENQVSIAFVSSALYHAVLPVTSLVLARFGVKAISMRANSIRLLGEDYLRVARLRGLSERRIGLRYVARNAILPLYTAQLIAIKAVFGGSVILETIFRYQGVGYYIFQGVVRRDYPLMMGGFLITTLAVIVGILLADFTYSMVDPRVQTGESRESF
jgi:peptide/nickel transport system permease protein